MAGNDAESTRQKVKDETIRDALQNDRIPPWHVLSKDQQRELMAQILLMMAQNKRIPDKVINALPAPILNRLLEILRKLKNQGMMSHHFSVSDRIKWLRKELGQTRQEPKEPTEDEVLAAQPAEMRNDVLANEALAIRDMRAREAQDMSDEIAARSNPALGI